MDSYTLQLIGTGNQPGPDPNTQTLFHYGYILNNDSR